MNKTSLRRRTSVAPKKMIQAIIEEEALRNNLESKENFVPKKPFWSSVADTVGDILDNNTIYTIISTSFTIYSLFADDLRTIVCTLDTDYIFWVMTAVVFVFFMIEILLGSLCLKNYFNSFYFWLDFLSTLTMLMDIGWFTDIVFGTGGSSSVLQNGKSGLVIARAARASKIGSKAGRLIRIIRLIRLIRLAKLKKISDKLDREEKTPVEDDGSKYNGGKKIRGSSFANRRRSMFNRGPTDDISENGSANNLTNKLKVSGIHSKMQPNGKYKSSVNRFESVTFGVDGQANQPNSSNIDSFYDKQSRDSIGIGLDYQMADVPGDEQDQQEESVGEETNIGKRLNDITTRRVVVIVLLLTFMIVLFSAETYTTQYSNYHFAMTQLYLVLKRSAPVLSNVLFKQWDTVIEMVNSEPEYLITLQLQKYDSAGEARNVLVYGDITEVTKVRSTDLNSFCYPNDDGEGLIDDVQACLYVDGSYYQKMSAIFNILKTLAVASVLVGASFLFSKDLTDLILMPIENMLKIITSIQENPLNAIKIEEERAITQDQLRRADSNALREQEELDGYETAVLERIVLKIGSLLAISFGEAGAELIVHNIKASGALNPIMPGRKVDGIFGFCDIRSFTDITEILREEVMTFVNSMAQIVHSIVDANGGAANKNIGDAFLFVWKFPLEAERLTALGLPTSTRPEPVRACVADLSVLAFVKILVELRRSHVVDKYNKNEKLLNGLKNFSVRVGCGITRGWAIEGSLGSEYKIDASYLSPFVNLSMRLEGATKEYGIPLLISDAVRDTCSLGFQELLRKVDSCSLLGSPPKVDLYSLDGYYGDLQLAPKNKSTKPVGLERKRQSFNKRQQKKAMIRSIISGDIKAIELFQRSKDLQSIRAPFKPKFFEIWEDALELFQAGNWAEAKPLLSKTLTFVPQLEDGPSRSLIKTIDSHDGHSPSDWNGLRKLD